jgi:hypothetical protein
MVRQNPKAEIYVLRIVCAIRRLESNAGRCGRVGKALALARGADGHFSFDVKGA